MTASSLRTVHTFKGTVPLDGAGKHTSGLHTVGHFQPPSATLHQSWVTIMSPKEVAVLLFVNLHTVAIMT